MTLASPLSIVLVNKSTILSDVEITRCAVALEVQLQRDFAPHWGIDGTVQAMSSAPAGALPVYILDDSDQAGALGYHDNDPKLGPFGRVFAKTDRQYGLNWTVTTSHEVLELAADPFVVSTAQINRTSFTALEVCDAVEADADGYVIGGTQVSDFVTPAWFGAGTGPVDFRKLLTKPFTLRKGGYMSVWTASRGWTQKTASTPPGVTSRAKFAHRGPIRKARPEAQTNQFEVAEA